MSDALEVLAFNARTLHQANGCIEWIGPRNALGYGRFTFKRKQRLAHRAAWQLFNGGLASAACVLHRCDNPPCVNPAHLFIGDRGDNARDMASKGRQWVQQNPQGRPICATEFKARGSAHGNAKLTEADVMDIRTRRSRGERGKDLANEYGCATSLISQIVRGIGWNHVGGPIKAPRIKDQE